jgi:IS1 family transposase
LSLMNCGPLLKKELPELKDGEDDGNWVWVSMAPESRLVVAHAVGERKQYMADKIVGITKERLASIPLFVTDGLKQYTKALLKHYGKQGLKYAQVIKHRQGKHLTKVVRRVIFGNGIDLRKISTSLIERLNLTLRQDNNRVSRKTIGFSKKRRWLDIQMTLYFANFNFCRGHGSLKYKDENGIYRKNSPAKEQGLIDHNWTLRELLTHPYYIT